ncbi:DUF3168 domain-containing protein [Rhodoplanes roseus]|nr:DUF3168 domain-containing protein [Rhodoplanes roseus]
MSDGLAVQLQTAVVARLRAAPAVVALCPADQIVDRSSRPETDVLVVVGEDQIVREDVTLADNYMHAFITLHLWHKAEDLRLVKNLADAVRSALRSGVTIGGGEVSQWRFQGSRFLRDPGGEYAHAVVTFESLIAEAVS